MDDKIYSNISFYKQYIEHYNKRNFFIYSALSGKAKFINYIQK